MATCYGRAHLGLRVESPNHNFLILRLSTARGRRLRAPPGAWGKTYEEPGPGSSALLTKARNNSLRTLWSTAHISVNPVSRLLPLVALGAVRSCCGTGKSRCCVALVTTRARYDVLISPFEALWWCRNPDGSHFFLHEIWWRRCAAAIYWIMPIKRTAATQIETGGKGRFLTDDWRHPAVCKGYQLVYSEEQRAATASARKHELVPIWHSLGNTYHYILLGIESAWHAPRQKEQSWKVFGVL